MAKKKHWAFPLFPKNAKRITKDGRRVWIVNGKSYESKRAYFESMVQNSQEEPEKSEVEKTEFMAQFAKEEQ